MTQSWTVLYYTAQTRSHFWGRHLCLSYPTPQKSFYRCLPLWSYSLGLPAQWRLLAASWCGDPGPSRSIRGWSALNCRGRCAPGTHFGHTCWALQFFTCLEGCRVPSCCSGAVSSCGSRIASPPHRGRQSSLRRPPSSPGRSGSPIPPSAGCPCGTSTHRRLGSGHDVGGSKIPSLDRAPTIIAEFWPFLPWTQKNF